MSPLAILGFLTVIIMLVLIMTKKASPLVALIVVPVVTGIISCFFIAVVPEGAAEGTQGVVDFVANFKSLGDMIPAPRASALWPPPASCSFFPFCSLVS